MRSSLLLAVTLASASSFAASSNTFGAEARLLPVDRPTAIGAPRTLSLLPTVLAVTEPAAGGQTAAGTAAPGAAQQPTTIFGLPRNEGPIDRVLRGVVFLALAGVGTYGLVSKNIGTAGSAVMIGVSVIPLVTALTGYCPLYQLFGVKESF
jgi:hypothetical protein